MDGGCRWVSEFVSDGEVSTDDVLADNGPFRELGAMERQAIARGLRETGGECGIHGEGPRFRVEITWKPSE